MIKIVLDAFGGDNAPVETVKGAVMAINKYPEIKVVLTGKQDVLTEELSKYQFDSKQITILNATEVIDNNESPTVAIKSKKDSSLVKAFDLAKDDNSVVGVISAGSTGAALTGGFLKLGRIKGIHRPALCPVFSTLKGGQVCICDCGANMDTKPEYLEQFAMMASAYMTILGVKKPRVALLNVGVEEHKGDTRTKEAYELLKNNKNINFVGNMEARELMSGEYDVVVTDGFAGNVLLKSYEGAMKGLLSTLKTEIQSSTMSKIGALFMKKTFKNLKNKFDYSSQGGAVLLGCEKLLVKGHGSSSAESIMACIGQVYTMHKGKLIQKIKKNLEEVVSND
ncbi:MAG: phosphate acyltransferase PlsX [Christensenellales bacterium]